MTKILVCVDGSKYADNICTNAAWVAKRLGAKIGLLHVLRRHSDYEAPHNDHTGSIGFGARSDLLEELTKVDEERGKLDQRKGKIILAHAETLLTDLEVPTDAINTLHRRGALVETILELESDTEIIMVGKRGEHANMNSEFLGSNLEKIVRAVHKPIFVTSSVIRPIQKVLIAYDGNDSAKKAVDYVASSPLFKDLEIHLLTVEGKNTPIDIEGAKEKLHTAGFDIHITTIKGTTPDQAISDYVAKNEIDLLATGAYSHSRIRSILLGSTTASLIKSCHIPLLLFR